MNKHLVIYTPQSYSEEDFILLINSLNILLEENQHILENIYQKDLFIKSTMGELIEKFPELWSLYNRIKGELKWLAEMVGLTVEEELPIVDNPYIKEEDRPISIDIPKKESCKTMFKKISSLTHPDKVKNTKLNNYFITAKKLYKKQDLAALIELYDLIIVERFTTKTSDIDLIKAKINTTKSEIDKNKNLLITISMSEDNDIAVKYKNNETRLEAEHLFTIKITAITNHLISQLNDLKSKIYGATSNA